MYQLYKCNEVIRTTELYRGLELSQIISCFGKMVINTFMISNEDLSKSLGAGIYLSASAMDHSCSPNCIVIFNGIELSIRSISKDLKSIDQVNCLMVEINLK